jgi:hypothetical protein
MTVSVLLSVMRIKNDIIKTSFPHSVTLIYQAISYELTPLFPDGVECTHLILLASHSLQLFEIVHLPACAEA